MAVGLWWFAAHVGVQAQEVTSTNSTSAVRAAVAPAGPAVSTNAAPDQEPLVSLQTSTNDLVFAGMGSGPLFSDVSLDLGGIETLPSPTTERATVTGPLVKPFTGKPAQIPSRLLNLFNPFAPIENPPAVVHKTNVRGLSGRSWTTVAGWRPGRTEFSGPEAFEPTSALIIVNWAR